VQPVIILVNIQTDALFSNVFIITPLYMFPALDAHHQESHIVLIRHLVYFTLCRYSYIPGIPVGKEQDKTRKELS